MKVDSGARQYSKEDPAPQNSGGISFLEEQGRMDQ